MKILIIEDEDILLENLTTAFMNAGYDVISAIDGMGGLARALAEKPNIVLLDLMLPKIDGLSVLKKLRKSPLGKKVPVIVLTNNTETKNMAEALAYESYDYLIKTDWKLEDVVNHVNKRLHKVSKN